MDNWRLHNLNELQSIRKLLSIRNIELREQLTTMIGVYEEFNVIFRQATDFVSPHVNYVDEKVSLRIDSPTRGNSELNWEDVIFNLESLCKDKKFIMAVSAIRNYTYDVANWNELTIKEFEIFQKTIQKELDTKKLKPIDSK